MHTRGHGWTQLSVFSPVNLGGVLAREGTASVGAPSSVGVDNDLATGQTSITLQICRACLRQALENMQVAACAIYSMTRGMECARHTTGCVLRAYLLQFDVTCTR
jgi:hypothetical protein